MAYYPIIVSVISIGTPEPTFSIFWSEAGYLPLLENSDSHPVSHRMAVFVMSCKIVS